MWRGFFDHLIKDCRPSKEAVLEPESPPPSEIPGSALNDGAPLHPEPQPAPQPEEPPAPEAKKKREKKEVPDHLKPEVLAKYDAETLKLLNAMDATIDTLYDDALAKKASAKEAKDAWEAKRDELQRLIKERKSNRGKPVQKTLLDTVPPTDDQPPPAEPLAAPPVPEPSALDLLWRDYPLSRFVGTFGMTERDAEILASGERKGGLGTIPVRTMGELADYSRGDGSVPRHIADFKGLGASGATRIDAACENFWGWWNGGGMTEYARERGIPDAVDPTESGAGGATAGDGGEGDQPGEYGGAGGGDGADGEDTVVFVEHLLNDPDAVPSPTDEDLAAIPAGNDATYSLDGEGEAD